MSRKARIKGLSEYLAGKSVHTLYKLVRGNRIPYERVGRDLYFDLDRIDAWMANQGNADAVELQSSQAAQEQEAHRIAGEIFSKV